MTTKAAFLLSCGTAAATSSAWAPSPWLHGAGRGLPPPADCSAPDRYGACWPAIQKDADAVILVYNPSEPSDEHDLPLWCGPNSHFPFRRPPSPPRAPQVRVVRQEHQPGRPTVHGAGPPAVGGGEARPPPFVAASASAVSHPARSLTLPCPARTADSLKNAAVVESDHTSSPTIAKAFARFLSQVRPFWNDRTAGSSGK